MRICRARQLGFAFLLAVVPNLVACNGAPIGGGHLTASNSGPSIALLSHSEHFTDTTIVKSGPFASSYEVRGPRRGYFFPPNAIITVAGKHLLVRSYGQIFVYRLTGARVRRMSSLVWMDPKRFPTERSDAILLACRKSSSAHMRRVAEMTCPDCDALRSDPAPPSGPPFPIPPRPPIPLPAAH
jgi:hypothetical protein